MRLAFDKMHLKMSFAKVTDILWNWSRLSGQWRINSLWPSDAIWRQRSGSTLAEVMACCLTAPSHYLNQCWLIMLGPVIFIWEQFHKIHISHQSLNLAWKLFIWNFSQITQILCMIFTLEASKYKIVSWRWYFTQTWWLNALRLCHTHVSINIRSHNCMV